jgi:cadmium resistance protein CadD (predicted permease)
MNPDSVYGLSSILCFSLPIIVILYFRLYRHASILALIVYYTLNIFHCINQNTVPSVPDFKNTMDVIYTYIEIPLMLTALLFFCPVKEKQQKIHIVTGFFVGFEIIVSVVFGFTPTASIYIMAPGLLIVTGYSGFLFLRQLKFTIMHGKNVGRVIMLGAILFSYSFYLTLFYAYFINQQADITSVYLLYFISSTVAAVLMSIGLYLMRNRIRDLQELKVTRRELQLFFGS